MRSKVPESTTVEIFGASYALRGGRDREYLLGLARMVDEKMREVAEATGATDTSRTAILAALNLADELFQSREQQDGERSKVKESAARLRGVLERALGA